MTVIRSRKPVDQVVDALHEYCADSTFYILTTSPNSICNKHKDDWLDLHFNVSNSNRYKVSQSKYKVEMLQGLQQKLHLQSKDITLIDDSHSILTQASNAGYNPVHPSRLLTGDF